MRDLCGAEESRFHETWDAYERLILASLRDPTTAEIDAAAALAMVDVRDQSHELRVDVQRVAADTVVLVAGHQCDFSADGGRISVLRAVPDTWQSSRANDRWYVTDRLDVAGPGIPWRVAASKKAALLLVAVSTTGTQAEHSELALLDVSGERIRVVEKRADLLDVERPDSEGTVRWHELPQNLSASVDATDLPRFEARVSLDEDPPLEIISTTPWLQALERACDPGARNTSDPLARAMPCGAEIVSTRSYAQAGVTEVVLRGRDIALRCGPDDFAQDHADMVEESTAIVTLRDERSVWRIIGIRPRHRDCAARGTRLPTPSSTPEAGVEVLATLDHPLSMGGGVDALYWSADPLHSEAYGAAGPFTQIGMSSGDRADFATAIHGLKPGEVRLGVVSDAYPPPAADVKVNVGKDDDVTIVLPPPGIIEGRVVTASGAPVAGVSVWLDSDSRAGNLAAASSREDGTFTLRKLAAGSYRVVAGVDIDKGTPVSVQAGETATTKIVVEVEDRDGSITGQVVDAAGAPVTDAFVYAQRESDAGGYTIRAARWGIDQKPSVTSTDGRFRIEGLSAGAHTVLAYQKGGLEAAAQGVAVGASVTIKLHTGGALSGAVTSPDGAPRTMTITVEDWTTGYERSEAFLLTAGRWAMRDLPAGTYEVRAVTSAGKAVLHGVVLLEGQERTALDLSIVPNVVVTGRVVDAVTGAPVEGIRVLIVRRGGGTPGNDEIFDPRRVSDSAGRFRAENVTPGADVLALLPPFDVDTGYAPMQRTVDIQGTGSIDIGDVRIRASRLPARARPGDLGFTIAKGRTAGSGLTVASVDENGPAAGAGVAVGDVIVAVDGTEVTDMDASEFKILTRVPAGTVVALTLARSVTIAIKATTPHR